MNIEIRQLCSSIESKFLLIKIPGEKYPIIYKICEKCLRSRLQKNARKIKEITNIDKVYKFNEREEYLSYIEYLAKYIVSGGISEEEVIKILKRKVNAEVVRNIIE